MFEDFIIMSPNLGIQTTYDPVMPWLTHSYTEVTEDTLVELQTRLKDEQKKTLLLIDDFAAASWLNRGRKGSFADMGNNARWLNLSLIVITQNITSISPSFRNNAEGFIMFQTMIDKEKDILLAERNALEDKSLLEDMFNTATREDHSFFFQYVARDKVYHLKNFDTLLVATTNNNEEEDDEQLHDE